MQSFFAGNCNFLWGDLGILVAFSAKSLRLCLFRRISGGSNYLNTKFGVWAYANTGQHLFKREISFFEHQFQNVAQ